MTPTIPDVVKTPTAGARLSGAAAHVPGATDRLPRWLVERVTSAAYGLGGFLSLMLLWALIASFSPDLPTPGEAWSTLRTLLTSPFHDNGPNDKGIGLQLWVSLQRVFLGFGMAALVAVPVGFLIGANRRLFQAFNPVVQLLRPVSPLAWFPIGLVVFKDAPLAAVFVIFITALWPTIINTAFGVASVPEDHKNVARVFQFSRYKYVRHVLAPYALPSILTGMRISMGIAWMVIVAVEMLSGGTGIGFFVWDSYNASNLSQVCAAIFLIGGTGLLLDAAFNRLLALATYEEGRS
jgi:nitrate/nitrite transport system permease protein